MWLVPSDEATKRMYEVGFLRGHLAWFVDNLNQLDLNPKFVLSQPEIPVSIFGI